MLKCIFCETKIGVLHLGFSSGDCSLTILTVKSDFCAIYFCQLISSRSKIRWKKITQNLDSPAQNCFIICPWIETQREDTHFCLIRNTFYHFKWKASSKTSNYWMFCQDMKRLRNTISAFNQKDVRIWSLIEILAHGLSNWLIIELHFPVIPAVGYGVVKIDASNYWMFLHPIVGCTSNYWIASNSWISA